MDHTFNLEDDGSLDTVISCMCHDCFTGEDMRFNPSGPEDEDESFDRVEEAIAMAKEDFECNCTID